MTRLFTHMAPDSNEFLRKAFDTYYGDQGYVVYDRLVYTAWLRFSKIMFNKTFVVNYLSTFENT